MKLDSRALRYLTADDWRVLTAVETGSRNHELVPTPLIIQIAGLRSGSGVHKCISNLAKVDLVARMKNARYDGYRLTYGGLDFLALNTLRKQGHVGSVGNQIGTGKESDIYVVADDEGRQRALKIHRLGRISFRSVKNNRDYLRNRATGSWMYMSRLAAMKEFAFLEALHGAGFPVPTPVAQSRHNIVMALIDAFPLRQIKHVPDPAELYAELIAIILRLARYGLIHGDFNEFNILIREDEVSSAEDDTTDTTTDTTIESLTDTTPRTEIKLVPILIDFPQMLSVSHPNAESYFDRDVDCIKRFFDRRFGFVPDEAGPFFADAVKDVGKPTDEDGTAIPRLDVQVEASGFSRKMAKELERYQKDVGAEGMVDSDNRPAQDDGEDEDVGDDETGDVEAETTETEVPDISALDVKNEPEDQDVTALTESTTVAPKTKDKGERKGKKASGWVV